MIKLLKNEMLKLKKTSLLLLLLIVPLLGVIFGSINYYMNTAILKNEWISLWTQVYMIYGLIFLPVLVGIIVSFIWQSEHKNAGFIILLTAPINTSQILLAKIIASFSVILLCQIYFFILYFISGSFFNFASVFPIKLLFYLLILTLFVLVLISFQTYISIKINSFVLPIGASLALSIFSLVASSQNKIPFLHYVFATSSLTIAMNHYPEINYSINEWLSMTLFGIVIFSLFFLLQNYAIKRKYK